MANLSPRAQAALDFIIAYRDANGFPPTVREIGIAIDLASSSKVVYHLDRLEERGLIERAPSKSRAIKVIES